MSTYLEISQFLAREAGITRVGSTPSAVTGQTGDLLDVVTWAQKAWIEIQNRHVAPGWRWMRSTFSVNTSSGDDTYAGTDCTDTRLSAAVTRFARWIPEDDEGYYNVRIYLQSTGVSEEQYLIQLPWTAFRDRFKRGTQTNARPAYFTIDPQNNMVLGPKPDDIYVVTGEYQMSAQILAANGDTPEMPSRFHDLIAYRAMEKYAAGRASAEHMVLAKNEGQRLLRQLEVDQLPMMAMAGPLA